MDVRCEKCQTEYELDESRLKPGGVTVKCTNCGHMFKIRKRTPTNVGIPATDEGPTVRQPPRARTESAKDGLPSSIADGGSGPTERNWLVRLENGEQKTCRELATLQQWIVAGVATRESLISRTGKTWKRLGDIAELRQYFDIADEARSKRAARPTPSASPSPPTSPPPASSLEETPTDRFAASAVQRSTAPSSPPPPPAGQAAPAPQPAPARPAPAPSQPPKADPRAATEIQTTPNQRPQPQLGRESVPWASSEIKPTASIAAMPQGPSGGKFSAIKDEPAFAGRVRMDPGDDSSFDTSHVRGDIDDDALPGRARGSRAGTWIAVASLVVIAGAAGAVYMFLFAKPSATSGPRDAGAAVAVARDAGVGSASVKPIVADAAVATAPADPLDPMRAELASGVEPRLKGLYDSLADKTDGPSLAMRARLGAALAQSQLDRAGLEADKGAAEKLRKAAKQLAIEVSALAQKALKAKADDPYANLAMADVLRVQGKTAHDVDRYLQIAKAKASGDPQIQRAVAVAAAQTDLRDNFFDDVHKDLGAFESADDNAVRTVLALAAFAQNKPDDARPLVAKILAASPDHDVARALDKRLAVAVSTTDPLPPEDHGSPGKHPAQPPGPSTASGGDLSGDYDALVRKADAIAETNCAHATDLYNKALEQKPTGVEALTGIGYCNLNAKQFASAFSKFKTALAVSSRYEPALAGVAETYQQQGNKEQAIASWHAYLDAFPGAAKAKRQLEILGESDNAGGTSTAQGSAAPAPAPAPPPAPTPTPAPPSAPAPAPAPSPSAGSAAG